MEPVPGFDWMFLMCSAAFGGIAWIASGSRRERWRRFINRTHRSSERRHEEA
jgi:hypothetical protein